MNEEGKGGTFHKLAKLTDTFGHRYVTSAAYVDAAKYLINQLHSIGVDSVWTEEVANIPNWSRGNPDPGSAFLLKPFQKYIQVLALGNSTNTPKEGITAKVVVVKSFESLKTLPANSVNGSIVVFNQPWQEYGKSVEYRSKGAIEAAKRGAVAALVRSVTPQSLYTLHTGSKLAPIPGVADIPVASITVEDAELLNRLYDSGHQLEMKFTLNTKFLGYASSFNIIAEIKGYQYPEEMVTFGGHFDSWDVGEGAMDDGGGVAITWQSLAIIKALGLRPKRSIRAIFYAGEELGWLGGQSYYEKHKVCYFKFL